MACKIDGKLTLSLRWGSHTETVLQSLETSFGDKDFVDMTLACEGQSLQAHKVVVSACSSYLKQLLKDNPCPHPIVILKDVAMSELKCLLEFMYCGRVTVEQHQLDRLLEAAKMLGVLGLAGEESLEEMEDVEREYILPPSNKSDGDRKAQQRLQRERSESPVSNKRPRPIPPLQSILPQSLLSSSCGGHNPGVQDISAPLLENQSQESPSAMSPPPTLARLLSQSPIHAQPSQCSASRDLKVECPASKVDDSKNSCPQMVEIALQMKQEALDLDLEIENPTEALELEYQNPESDEPLDPELYHQQLMQRNSVSTDPAVHESIGKATAFMLSLAKRANQCNPYGSPTTERKLSFHEPRPCTICRKMFRDASTLQNHITVMHPTTRLNAASSLSPNGEGGSENRLAFYEARPCSICGKMYRDAASLRTHMSIMHTMWRDGFECSCKLIFQTKHEMYQHRSIHGKTKDKSIR